MTGEDAFVHGTCVALGDKAALLRGPSGSGKSDLALRFLAMFKGDDAGGPARLVADDQTRLSVKDGRLIAHAPAATKGLIEVRGVGIVEMEALGEAELALAVDLVAAHDIERLPDPKLETTLLGVSLPLLRLAAFESAAPIKLKIALGGAL